MPPADASTEALIGVITTLQAELSTQRDERELERLERARERERHAREREGSRREIARLVAMVEGLTQQLDELLRDRNEERQAELARLREEAQAALANQTADPEPGSDDEAPAKPEAKAVKRDEHGRKPIPPEIPRDTIPLREVCCPTCSSRRLSQEKVLVSEEWDYVRAHLRVRRHERTLDVCQDCDGRVLPDLPPMPFDQASCTFALMAWLCYAKVGLFLPLDRLRRDFADQGATIASSTLTRWWQRGADLLLPVAAVVRLSLLAGNHIRTDGTGLRVVFPRRKANPVKGTARKGVVDDDGYLLHRQPINGQILVFGDDEHAVFHFTQTKEGHHALDFLTMGANADDEPIRWKGTITADALNAHDCLLVGDDRIEAGCNAHGLRKFRDDADKAPLLASRALAFIGRFYTEEAKAREKQLQGADLLAWRTEHIAPRVAEFGIWIDTHLTDLLPTNPVRKAMQYYINHWDALTRFLADPAVELDNNWSERALRSVNLIRNNSLYAGGIDGAVRLCTLLTLIATCRLIKVDPYRYLEWAMTRVVAHPTNRGLVPSDLTPAAYKATQKGDAQ